MVSKFRRRDHALLVIRAHAILPQVPCRLGPKYRYVVLQGAIPFETALDYTSLERRRSRQKRSR
jgi:hypothetical protein